MTAESPEFVLRECDECGDEAASAVKWRGIHQKFLCKRCVEQMQITVIEVMTNYTKSKPIAVGYTPSDVGDTQEPTLEEVKDDYVSGDIDIIQLENKLEGIIEREQ